MRHQPADDEVFFAGFQHIVTDVRQHFPDIRITAIEPSPFDDVTRPITLQPSGYNAVLVNYSNWIRRYASERKLTVADLNTPVVEMLNKANAADPALAQKIIPDRVHPGLSGHLIMAEQLLKAWNARPLVAAVTIDAAQGKVEEARFAHVSNLQAGARLEWTELDEALPLPFAEMLAADRDHSIALAIDSSDITEALNEQPLRITGLKPGNYRLTIDGEAVGSWSDAELSRGVNLAVLDTPMSQQAAEVQALTVRHIDVHEFRWRNLQVPLESMNIPHLDESLKALDAVEADLVARRRSTAQPRPHVFRLVPGT